MNDSESAGQPSVITALNRVMRDVTKVEKKEENTMQHFRFRGVDATTKAVAPALREHGVVVVPLVEEYEYDIEEFGKNATKMGHVMVKVRYRWYGPGGDFIDTVSVGEATDTGDKCTAKAMSVAYRTCILQTLCLPTDDPDPDTDSYERSGGAPQTAKTPRGRGANDVVDWPARIAAATTVEELRVVWKDAGTHGVLKGVIQDKLYKRHDELNLKSGVDASGVVGAN